MKRTRIQEIVTKETNRLSRELAVLKKEAIESRDEIVRELEKGGILDDMLTLLKVQANEGNQVSLILFNLWKYRQLP